MERISEELSSGLVSGLRDLTRVPLGDMPALSVADAGVVECLRRVAPRDGAALPVAAFNSAI